MRDGGDLDGRIDVPKELDEIREQLAAVYRGPLLAEWRTEIDRVTDLGPGESELGSVMAQLDVLLQCLPELLGRLDTIHLRVKALELEARAERGGLPESWLDA
jgi:hypothetical protein